MADDWFRSPLWDDVTQEAFEARLRRAHRHNRQQYLNIKGMALQEVGHHGAARGLFVRAADEPDGHLHDRAFAWELLADMAAEEGDRVTAESLYRQILAELPNLNGTTGDIELSLAELLVDRGDRDHLREAQELLTSWLDRDEHFDNGLFRWHLILIRVYESTGDGDTVRLAARTALRLAARGPQFSRHPGVGLVQTDDATLSRLRTLAG